MFPISNAHTGSLSARRPFLSLPKDLNLAIFSFLKPEDLARSGAVCRSWRDFATDETLWNAFDIRKLSPLLKVFDEADWTSHVNLASLRLSMQDAPPLNKRKLIPILMRCLSSLPVEGNSGITFLTLPQGLTLNILLKIARFPTKGAKTVVEIFCARILKEFGDRAVDRTCRIVISNNVLVGSQNLDMQAQKNLLNKVGCEIPKLLEITTLLVVTFMTANQHLYNNKLWTSTVCEEQLDHGHLKVASEALGVDLFVLKNNSMPSPGLGTGAVLRQL